MKRQRWIRTMLRANIVEVLMSAYQDNSKVEIIKLKSSAREEYFVVRLNGEFSVILWSGLNYVPKIILIDDIRQVGTVSIIMNQKTLEGKLQKLQNLRKKFTPGKT